MLKWRMPLTIQNYVNINIDFFQLHNTYITNRHKDITYMGAFGPRRGRRRPPYIRLLMFICIGKWKGRRKIMQYININNCHHLFHTCIYTRMNALKFCIWIWSEIIKIRIEYYIQKLSKSGKYSFTCRKKDVNNYLERVTYLVTAVD